MTTPVRDYTGLLRLDRQVHLVVGAGRGIGLECARALASAGANVVCADLDPDRAELAAAEVGGRPAYCDVTDDDSVVAVLAEAEQLGPVRGVVDIVGAVRWTPLREATDDDWGWQDRIVARQGLRVLRCAAPALERAGAAAVTFVASVSALTSAPRHGLYGMSKAALRSMVRTAAVELGPLGVRVNSVSPGATRTPTLEERPGFEEALAGTARRTPLARLAEPQDVAAALLFLSSDLARHVTAHDLVVDGGLSQTWPLALPEDAS